MTKLLAANRGEIAIRILRAATELGLRTATIYSAEDRLSLHRFKADEAYQVGAGKGPVAAYLDIDSIVAIAKENGIQYIHPGYGFLSENQDFAQSIADAGLTFVGPPPSLLGTLGDKLAARKLAHEAGVRVVPGTDDPIDDPTEAAKLAEEIGFPVIVKAAFGGGGRGMRIVQSADELQAKIEEAQQEALIAFGNGAVFVERFVGRARHIEVQILADSHGNVMHLYERDCSVQRRHQKVVEIAPAPNISQKLRRELTAAAVKLARTAGYVNAGTVEFLVDADTEDWFFIEVNPRIQVEHTVTEVVTGIDLVQAQILIAQGAKLNEAPLSLPPQEEIQTRGFAIQCRITTEDPEDNFAPDYGRLMTYRSPSGFGIRLDGATAYSGAQLTPYYDSLLVKMTASNTTLAGACRRADRALREFRIRGVKTNIPFLENVVNHPVFQAGETTTGYLDQHPELFTFVKRRDRATRLLTYIGDVIVNGNPHVQGKPHPASCPPAPEAAYDHLTAPAPGTRDKLLELGPKKFAEWVRNQEPLLITDTTFRDAHQSLLATRVRTYDLLATAEAVSHNLPNLFSLEMWGGATFDASMRFLQEDPWERLARLREKVPNICFQMLLRASNAVGYAGYPDNVVREFVLESFAQGMDIFRIFDSLNDVDQMVVAIEATLETDAVCEPAICYTGDILDPTRPKYDLAYYISLAKRLEEMGAHILAIKDMAGLCRPFAARQLVGALKQEVGLPIHFHTHDSSGLNAATLLEASEAQVDIVDAAVAAVSGGTSQPNLNSLVASLDHTPRAANLDQQTLSDCSLYWETVRAYYLPFDNAPRHGSADIYLHEIPGGQFTNLQQQAEAMGLGARWREVERMYADVNQLFGDIVKVTPSSKVVGDMALFLLTHGMTCAEVLELDPNDHQVAFPDSVRDMMNGALGFPPGGWPEKVQSILLRGAKPQTGRAGALLQPANFETAKSDIETKIGRKVTHSELLSSLLYPKVFADFAQKRRQYSDVSVLPTPIFFYGMSSGEETTIDIEAGKRLVVKFLTVGDPHTDGSRTIFFELNGQPRQVRVRDSSLQADEKTRRKADPSEPGHIAAPTPGLITGLFVQPGDAVKRNDKLLTLEAMKMQSTIYAPQDGKVSELLVEPGDQVEAKDLLAMLV